MHPLTERSNNTHNSPQPARVAAIGREKVFHPRISDENTAPQGAVSRMPASQRLLSHTKASAARSATCTPSPQPTQTTTPASKLPRLTHTPTPAAGSDEKMRTLNGSARRGSRILGAADTVVIHSKAQNVTPVARLSTSTDKPLPPRPIAQVAGGLSPTKDSRSLIDAIEQPLRTSPGTPQEQEWQPLSPERKAAPTYSTSSRETGQDHPFSAADTRHSSPPHRHGYGIIHAPLRSASLRDQTTTSEIKTGDRALRTERSASANSTTKSETPVDERVHSPPPMSFSQPYVKRPEKDTSRQGTPTPLYSASRGHATASRIPIHSSKKGPQIVSIRGKSPVGILTFGERKLNSREALETLDQSSPSKRKSAVITKNDRESSNESLTSLFPKAPAKATSSPKLRRQPSSTSASDSGSVVKQISGQLLSTSFAGSTVTIFNDADDLVFGDNARVPPLRSKKAIQQTSATSTLDGSAETTSTSSSKALHGEAILHSHEGASTHSESGSEQLYESYVLVNAKESPDDGHIATGEVKPGQSTPQKLGETKEAINHEVKQHVPTLSILEGTSESPNPSPEEMEGLAGVLGRDRRRQVVAHDSTVFHPAHRADEQSAKAKEDGLRMPRNQLSDLQRVTATTLPQYTEKANSTPSKSSHAPTSVSSRFDPRKHPSDRAPSYTYSTSVSANRSASTSTRPSVTFKEGKSIGYPSRIPPKASAIIGPADPSDRVLSLANVSKRTAASVYSRTNPTSPPHIPLSRFMETEEEYVSPTKPKEAGTKSDRFTGHTMSSSKKAKSKVPRSQSKSRFMIHNIKGLFSSKKDSDVPPLPQVMDSTLSDCNTVVNGSPISKKSNPATPSVRGSEAAPKKSTEVKTDDKSVSQKEFEVATLTKTTMTLMEQAMKEKNTPAKERMLSLAQVMLDAIQNSREAERSMLEAKKAADAARISYELTQHSIAEMGRLMASRNMPSMLKKLAKTAY